MIVVAFSLHSQARVSNGLVELLALAVVCIAHVVVHSPLRHVSENAIKFVVGAMICFFGTFWTTKAVAGDVWPESY